MYLNSPVGVTSGLFIEDRAHLCRWATICYGLLLLGSVSYSATAQSLVLDAVSITTSAESFRPALPSYESFVAGAREPALFAQRNRPDALKGEAGAFATLGIDFSFRLDTTPHRFVAGFERSTLDANLFSAAAADSATSALKLEVRNEYFGVGAGYVYQLIGGRRLSASAGAVVRVMLPVSAKTIERSGIPEPDNENTFFSRKALALGLSIPVSLGLRVFRSTDLELTVAPGVSSVGLDGSRGLARQLRTSIGLRFHLNKP